MNYQKIYYDIIFRAKIQNRSKKNGYYELHHITPRALGGDNSNENKVLLTAREHFICHKCLVLFLEAKSEKMKMKHALHRFLYSKNYPDYKIKARDYEQIKKAHNEAVSFEQKGRKVSEEAKRNMSAAQKKRFESAPSTFKGKKHTKETRELMCLKQAGELNPQFGKPRSDGVRNKISNTMKGHKKSAETVEKFKARRWSEEKKKQISETVKKRHAERRMAKEMGSSLHECSS